MKSAYVASLNRNMGAAAGQPPVAPLDLRTRFLEWYASVPQVSRDRAFAMTELEQALDTQGKYLSPVLLSLGWTRKRRWSSQGQYNRYWMPPGSAGDRPPL